MANLARDIGRGEANRVSCAMLRICEREGERDGGAIVAVRSVWPSEMQAVERHLLRLSHEDRRMRFGRPVSHEFIRSHVTGLRGAECIVKCAYVGDVCRGVGEIHLLNGAGYDAEAALSVEHAWQGQGIGDLILKSLLLSGRNRGRRRIVVFCLNENRRMLALARRNLACLSITPDGAIGEFRRDRGTLFTWQQELIDEGLGHMLVFPVFGPREPDVHA